MAGGYQTLNLKGLDFGLNSTSDDKVQFTSKTITIGG